MASPRQLGHGLLARLTARVLVAALVVGLLPATAQASLPATSRDPRPLPRLPLRENPSLLVLAVVLEKGAPCAVSALVRDPFWGPSVGMDPWEGNVFDPPTLHRYLYVRNDPVNRVDPTGRSEYTVGGLLTAMAIGATIFGTSTYIRTQHFGAAANSALTGALVGATFYAALPYAVTALWRLSLLTGGGAAATGGGSGTVVLYRAMSNAEFQELVANGGRFAPGGGQTFETGKWFAETLPNAVRWGEMFARWNQTEWVVAEVRVAAPAAQNFLRTPMLDGVGPARFAQLEQINGFVQGVTRVYP